MRHMFLRPYISECKRPVAYSKESSWSPYVNIYETDNEYIIDADLPGVPREDIDIKLSSGVLHIKGERKVREQAEGIIEHKKEMPAGNFERSFSLPEDIDEEKITAELKDGLLELKIAKAEEKKPRSVSITIH